MGNIFKIIIGTFNLSVIRYFIMAGIPFLIFYQLLSHRFSKLKIQERDAVFKDFKRDILHSIQSMAVFAVIGFLIFHTPFSNLTHIYHRINDYPVWWLFVSLVLSLVIHDTYFYWMHRLLHHKKVFRYAHLVHHKSTNPSPWTSYSFHFIESWTEGLVLVAIVLILPIHAITVLLFLVTAFFINVYGHLGYEIAPKGFRKSILFEVLNSSVFHNMHHSRFKGNYGLYFRIWDRVMGTENPDYVKEYDRIQEKRFGDQKPLPKITTNEEAA